MVHSVDLGASLTIPVFNSWGTGVVLTLAIVFNFDFGHFFNEVGFDGDVWIVNIDSLIVLDSDSIQFILYQMLSGVAYLYFAFLATALHFVGN